jgi:arabinose-5-phosphate isomerase
MHIIKDTSVKQICDRYAERLINSLKSTIDYNEFILDDLANAMYARLKTDSKLLFMGVGKNAYLSQKLAATFQSLNFQSSFFDANHALHGDLGFLKNGDILFAFSKSGKTSELLQTLRYIKSLQKFKDVLIVSMYASYGTSEQDGTNDILNLSNYVIEMPYLIEADDAETVPTVSALVMQFIGDALALKLTALTKLTTEQFKLTHPGGNIGQTL